MHYPTNEIVIEENTKQHFQVQKAQDTHGLKDHL